MALQVDIYRVDHRDGFSMPRIALANRRAAGAPQLQWICQRHLEILLFNRTDGGSSGAIWKALSQSGLGSTSLCCSKKAVSDGVLLAAEFAHIMAVFKQALPADVCDPSSLGRSARSASAPTHSLALPSHIRPLSHTQHQRGTKRISTLPRVSLRYAGQSGTRCWRRNESNATN